MSEEQEIQGSRKRKGWQMLKSKSWVTLVIIGTLSFLITLPVFLIVYQYVPSLFLGEMRVDHLLLFVPMWGIIGFITYRFKMIIYLIGAFAMIWIMLLTIQGSYSFRSLIHDYKSMVYALQNGAIKIDFLEKGNEFTNEDRIRAAIDYNEESVRNYAVDAATKNFLDESKRNIRPGRTVIQAFSIFKELKRRWVYVHDPQFEDYYAKASETVKHLVSDGLFKGDCDDYSILMAGCIKAIGGEVRLVRTRIERPDGSEVGHIYPEVLIGDDKDLEAAMYLIKEEFFEKWTRGKEVYYHEDDDGRIWLNFDYNDEYPGGPYQSKVRLSEIQI